MGLLLCLSLLLSRLDSCDLFSLCLSTCSHTQDGAGSLQHACKTFRQQVSGHCTAALKQTAPGFSAQMTAQMNCRHDTTGSRAPPPVHSSTASSRIHGRQAASATVCAETSPSAAVAASPPQCVPSRLLLLVRLHVTGAGPTLDWQFMNGTVNRRGTYTVMIQLKRSPLCFCTPSNDV